MQALEKEIHIKWIRNIFTFLLVYVLAEYLFGYQQITVTQSQRCWSISNLF